VFNSTERTDDEIILAIRSKDEKALVDAYERYGRLVQSVLRRITRDSWVADELLHDVFLRVWTNADVFDSTKASLSVWVVSIARNLAIDYLRSAASKATLLLPAAGRETAFELAHSRSGPTRVSDLSVRAALAKLTGSQRRVLELAYFEGYSHSEIAEHLAKPLGTVKAWMRSALKSMRSTMLIPPIQMAERLQACEPRPVMLTSAASKD
jgi:RNA polymerase sigma-70 factor (ECF subfamily)